jgi:hypothetical protein
VKRLIVLASMTIALGGVAGCSGTGGHPEPTTTGPATSNASSNGDPGTVPTTQTTSNNIADTNACSLLTASEATSLGLPSTGETQDNGAKSGCEWDGSTYIVGVLIRTNVGLAGVLANGGTITNTQVGSHQAKQLTEAGGDCLYAIGINDSTRVDVSAGTIGSTASTCPQALSAAELVEKHLSSAGS